ncbi:hypothetical protein GUJ93_ZPchr0007g5639 [Zizania palustris]|uniref:Uncharacterized protein n=1 Tax=Zizania palustris TaxID=103762 RepID=A0A8J5W5Z1_ZIZPA|nr:hypothetical protein GUJ93_ZPchr0007g5639 [Zizania palustris]
MEAEEVVVEILVHVEARVMGPAIEAYLEVVAEKSTAVEIEDAAAAFVDIVVAARQLEEMGGDLVAREAAQVEGQGLLEVHAYGIHP